MSIGPNGAGKTTLFRLIMGLETVDKGTFEVGETVKLAYVDQQHKDIDPAKSVYQVISGGNELIRLGNRDITRVPTSAVSIFREPTRRNFVECFRVVSATACIWLWH